MSNYPISKLVDSNGNNYQFADSELRSATSGNQSASNPLMDKEWIEWTVNNMAARYLSKSESQPFSSYAEFEAAQPNKFYYGVTPNVSPTNNDYVLINGDETHANAVTRYVYINNSWIYQYTINSIALTPAQVLAINSGITSTLVTNFSSHLNNNNIHVTSNDKSAWNSKVDFLGNLKGIIGNGSPASDVKNYWTNNVPKGKVQIAYNSGGDEYTLIFSRQESSNYGTVVRFGYKDNISKMEILRIVNNGWVDNDWIPIIDVSNKLNVDGTNSTESGTNNILNALDTGSDDFFDDDLIIGSSHTDANGFVRRTFTKLFNRIKSKFNYKGGFNSASLSGYDSVIVAKMTTSNFILNATLSHIYGWATQSNGIGAEIHFAIRKNSSSNYIYSSISGISAGMYSNDYKFVKRTENGSDVYYILAMGSVNSRFKWVNIDANTNVTYYEDWDNSLRANSSDFTDVGWTGKGTLSLPKEGTLGNKNTPVYLAENNVLTVCNKINDATLTIQMNGSSKGTFTANASSNKTIDLGSSVHSLYENNKGQLAYMRLTGTQVFRIGMGRDSDRNRSSILIQLAAVNAWPLVFVVGFDWDGSTWSSAPHLSILYSTNLSQADKKPIVKYSSNGYLYIKPIGDTSSTQIFMYSLSTQISTGTGQMTFDSVSTTASEYTGATNVSNMESCVFTTNIGSTVGSSEQPVYMKNSGFIDTCGFQVKKPSGVSTLKLDFSGTAGTSTDTIYFV